MRKIITIAVREYKAMVATKAFLLSIILMPIIMLGSIVFMSVLQSQAKVKTRRIALVDHTGIFSTAIKCAAEAHNRDVDTQIVNGQGSGLPASMGLVRERYQIETVVAPANATDRMDQLLELSDRIRDQQLYAILEIPDGLSSLIELEELSSGELNSDEVDLDSVVSDFLVDNPDPVAVRFYSQQSSLAEAKRWLSKVINQHLRNERLRYADIDPETVAVASQPLRMTGMGLFATNDEGRVTQAPQQQDPVHAIFVPLAVLLLSLIHI